jgi:hypothetical protein
VRALPESSEVEVNATVEHQCGFGSSECSWYGQAAAYAAGTECPSVFDLSHGVGSGRVEQGSGSSSWQFAFPPYGIGTIIKICLYVNAEEDRLVGESHPFNLNTHSEVLPQPSQPSQPPPPPRRYPTKTTVAVSLHGCKFWPHVAVNGKKEIGGKIVWAIYFLYKGRWHREVARTEEVAGAFRAFTYTRGTYRFSARFLGDENLLPSAQGATYVFRIKGKSCVPNLEEAEARSDLRLALANKVEYKHASLGPAVEGLQTECKRISHSRFACKISFNSAGVAWTGTGQIWTAVTGSGWEWDYSLNLVGYPPGCTGPACARSLVVK